MCLAIPGRIVAIEPSEGKPRVGQVDFPGRELVRVELALLPEARVGDHVLVHSGLAFTLVSAEAAEATIGLLASLDGNVPPG